MVATEQREGFIEAPGGRVWYKIVGDGPGVPLLLLHGGPGSGHDYLEPLEALADERPVVFYDQLGCGKSDIPDDTSLWHIDRFVKELVAVREALGLTRIHLLGQSWGGWLAIEYMLTGKADGVVSLTLASTSASAAGFVEGCKGLIADLPQETQDTIARCEAEGDTHSADYQAATFAFYMKHLCRIQPWPPAMMRTGLNIQNTPVYGFMWGPSEFTVSGNLATWDRSSRLAEIAVPTLVTTGRYDEMVLSLGEELRDGISGARLVVFENSSHSAHTEETDAFLATLRDFLARTEAA